MNRVAHFSLLEGLLTSLVIIYGWIAYPCLVQVDTILRRFIQPRTEPVAFPARIQLDRVVVVICVATDWRFGGSAERVIGIGTRAREV